MDSVLIFVLGAAIAVLIGCLWGLIPFYLGRSRYRPNLGRWGLIWCGVAGPFGLSFFVMLGFVIAILVGERDVRPPSQASGTGPSGNDVPVRNPEPPARGGLVLVCLAGPLKGQRYNVSQGGLMFGRDSDCTVRFSPETGGISRHHCALRWQQGVPVLVDLGSAYGTFLGDGTQLPPNYPTTVGPGTRFYLASPSTLFQITTT